LGKFGDQDEIIEEAIAAISMPTEMPDPHAPTIRKRDLYTDPIVFKELDEDVFKVKQYSNFIFLLPKNYNCTKNYTMYHI